MADVVDGGGELVDDELDPELGDLMLDDEQHFVMMLGLRERALLREEVGLTGEAVAEKVLSALRSGEPAFS